MQSNNINDENQMRLLVRLYENHPCLYVDNAIARHTKVKKWEARQKIITEFHELTGIELENLELSKIINRIRTKYMGCKIRIQKSKNSAAVTDQVYQPKWYLFKLLSFLDPHLKVRQDEKTDIIEGILLHKDVDKPLNDSLDVLSSSSGQAQSTLGLSAQSTSSSIVPSASSTVFPGPISKKNKKQKKILIDRAVDVEGQLATPVENKPKERKKKKKINDIDDSTMDIEDKDLVATVKSKFKVTNNKKMNVKENIVDDVDDKENSCKKKKKKKEQQQLECQAETATKKVITAGAAAAMKAPVAIEKAESSSIDSSDDEKKKTDEKLIEKTNKLVAKNDESIEDSDDDNNEKKKNNKKPVKCAVAKKIKKTSSDNLAKKRKHEEDGHNTAAELIPIKVAKNDHSNFFADGFNDDQGQESSTLEKNFDKLLGDSKIKKIIESGYYVDKTKYMQKLIEGQGCYYIIRPRRFGKSLMLNTISAICAGEDNRQLFENTAIGRSRTYKWKKYPVFQFNFSKPDNRSAEKFESGIIYQIKKNCEKYTIKHRNCTDIGRLLDDMLQGGANLKNAYEPEVVILIDEYDSPLNGCHNKNEIIQIMKRFFQNLKGDNINGKMVLVTGATRFGLSDVFSAANDLCDITVNEDVNAICGFTQSELTEVFKDKISELQHKLDTTEEKLLKKLKLYYNGFRFSAVSKDTVYNPWSIVQCFKSNDIKCYWDGKCLRQYEDLIFKDSESISLFRKQPEFTANDVTLNFDRDYKDINFKSLLFQTGYLTFKNIKKKNNIYRLKSPNLEVKKLLREVIPKNALYDDIKNKESPLLIAILNNDFELFIKRIRTHYHGWPYHNPVTEGTVHFFINGILAGVSEFTKAIEFKSEKASRAGRLDIEIKTDKYIYIIELKFVNCDEVYDKLPEDKTARAAINQIYDKNYHVAHDGTDLRIILAGIVFSKKDLVESERMYLEEYEKLDPEKTKKKKKELQKLKKLKESEQAKKAKGAGATKELSI